MAKKWNKEELEILRNNYATSTVDRLLEYLPERTYKAIENQANKQRLKKTLSYYNEKPIEFYEDKEYKVNGDLFGSEKIRFGVIGDTHLISIHQQLTHLKNFYKYAKQQGCSSIFHLGDVSEGNGNHYPGQIQEIFKHLLRDQVKYVVNNYPDDLPTFIISGDHDLDFYKIGAGDVVEEVAKQRDDFTYLGQHGAYFMLNEKVKIYLMHPMGGMAYAMSYKPQKFAEGFSGGTKPQILLIGHYHQAGYFFFRNIHIFLVGCFQSQTPYLLRKGLMPQVGGWIVEISIDKENYIKTIKSEFCPFYTFIENDY